MYHAVWVGGDLIFHRDSAQNLEVLKWALEQKKEPQYYSPCFSFILQLILACWFVIWVCLSSAPASDDVLSALARSECLCAILISVVSGEEREGGTKREGERGVGD